MLYAGLFAQLFYGYASLAAVLLALNLLWLVFVRLNSQLIELASRDALTRVLNRNGLDELVMRHFAARERAPIDAAAGRHRPLQAHQRQPRPRRRRPRAARGGRPRWRPTCAPATSSRASAARSSWSAASAADDGVAEALAERLLAGVRKLDVRLPGVKLPVHCTVSIGISRRCGDLTAWERCWAEADRALYAAKAAGRDRVVSVNLSMVTIEESGTTRAARRVGRDLRRGDCARRHLGHELRAHARAGVDLRLPAGARHDRRRRRVPLLALPARGVGLTARPASQWSRPARPTATA